jgi:hypothetical protein
MHCEISRYFRNYENFAFPPPYPHGQILNDDIYASLLLIFLYHVPAVAKTRFKFRLLHDCNVAMPQLF